MKALVISHMYPSSFNKALGMFVHQQVKELINQGCKVKVVSPVPWTPFPIKCLSKKWKKYSKIPQKMIQEGIEVYYPRYLEFPTSIFSASCGWRMYKGIKKTVVEIYKNFKFDIIHAHVPLPAGHAGLLLSKELHIPFIITVHGGELYYIPRKKEKAVMHKVMKSADAIVTVSNKNKEILKSLNLPNLNVIPNGVPLNLIQRVDVNKVKKIRETIKSKYFLLGVGDLVPRKKFDIAIRAVGELISRRYDILFVIIGEGPEKRSLIRLIKDLNIEGEVKILPRQKRLIEVYEYMKACDIFLLPSVMEGFGVVFAEVMAFGKPVIGCREGVVPDLIQNGKTGLLAAKDDVKEIEELIKKLIDNPKFAKEIGLKAKKMVLENYTWEQVAQKIIRIYKEVLGK